MNMNSAEDNSDAGIPNIPGPYISPEQTESFPLKQALYGGNRRVSKECCPCMDRDESSGLRVIVTCFFVLSLIITVALAAQIYFGDYQLVPHGSVATDSHYCSVIGTDILKKGGNSVDAAVASTFCMGVLQPHVTGLGAGGFLLVYDHRKRLVLDVIDFREIAPLNYMHSPNESAFQDINALKGQDIGVPGLVRGLALAHSLYGKLMKGFQVPHSLAQALRRFSANSTDNLKLQETFSSQPGANQTLPHLAEALEKIAILGPDVFYNGSLAASMLQTLSQAGSNITKQDLSDYTPKRRKALQAKFSNFEVFVPGAPSGGPLLLATLNLLKNTNITDEEEIVSVLSGKLNDMYENFKGDWGDPDQNQNETEVTGIAWNFPEAVTSHVAAVDLNDLYVSVVSGLNTWFGSQVMTDNEFILNNALKNFDVGNNVASPKKRPLSLAAPIIVTESGQVCGRRLVLGAADTTIAVQLLAELLLLHQNGTASIEAPRFHFKPAEKLIELEGFRAPILSNATVTLLQQMGFKFQKIQGPLQSCNVVEKIGDTLTSHSDSRGGGVSSRY
ncbi:Gamma-glutamyltransferase 7 [Gryllus bimaculatus]|nr:Gamma-glutamyltransferase 7 [Gryllus bimaculatus]